VENHLLILSESLDKKISVLEDIQAYNLKQEQAFLQDAPDMDEFDDALEEKEELIQRIEKLDEGFEILYERISKELQENRSAYAVQIKELQEKIQKVTDLSTAIQAQEARNKKLIEDYFSKMKAGIKQNRQGSKAAYDYYKNMSGAAFNNPQFMDSKH
jgi:predicted nuclease with TOPRIM domain